MPVRRRKVDTPHTRPENTPLTSAEGYPSGQRGQTVNLLAYAFVGSNPTPSTNEAGSKPAVAVGAGRREGGCSSMVEPQPSKLMMWVRFPSPAPDKNGHGEDGVAAGVSHGASRPHSSVGRALPW